eukprot:31487-Pelagococcus_subviridis.AAC.14
MSLVHDQTEEVHAQDVLSGVARFIGHALERAQDHVVVPRERLRGRERRRARHPGRIPRARRRRRQLVRFFPAHAADGEHAQGFIQPWATPDPRAEFAATIRRVDVRPHLSDPMLDQRRVRDDHERRGGEKYPHRARVRPRASDAAEPRASRVFRHPVRTRRLRRVARRERVRTRHALAVPLTHAAAKLALALSHVLLSDHRPRAILFHLRFVVPLGRDL